MTIIANHPGLLGSASLPARLLQAQGVDYANLKKTDAPTPRVEHVGSIRVVGRWRVYIHRANPDGLPWCVAPDVGGWELAVRSVSIVTPSSTVYTPKTTPDDEDGRPSAWIQASGVLVVDESGCARIEAAP